ncbi:MAG TPA: hypothetical protein VL356_09215 [Acidocella sp.]|jgi:hypothetical protein|nr:hypothetical protein [Acidocella sp.]
MTRLFADLLPVTLLAAMPLTACATAPPSEPTVFAVPSVGESLNQFQADDLACRNEVQPHTASPGAPQAAANRSAGGNAGAGAAVGASNTNAIAGGAQAQYDVAYTQCMMSKGNTIVTTPPDYGYAYPEAYPNYYAYPGGYPYYRGYPYYAASPYFIGTGPFFFGPRFHGHFHHEGFHHEGFHEGFHERFHGGFHEGFHHGGFHHGGFGHEGGGHFGH